MAKGFVEGKRIYYIIDVPKPAVEAVVEWLDKQHISAARVDFPTMTYYQYARVLAAADHLEVNSVYRIVEARMDRIAANQVPLADVKKVFEWYPAGHVVRQQVVASIASALWEKRLKACGLYQQFRAENDEYRDEVQACLRKLAEGAKAAREGGRRIAALETQTAHRSRGQHVPVAKEPKVVNKVIQGVAGRKAGGGKRWVRLDNSDLEIAYKPPRL